MASERKFRTSFHDDPKLRATHTTEELDRGSNQQLRLFRQVLTEMERDGGIITPDHPLLPPPPRRRRRRSSDIKPSPGV